LIMNKEIIFVISSLRSGGAERVCVTLLNGFFRNGYKVKLLVLNLQNEVYLKQIDKEIEVFDLSVKHARSSFYAFYKFFKNNKPEVVFSFNHELAVVIILLRYILNLKSVIISRNISTLSQQTKHQISIWHKYVKTIFIKYLYGKVNHIIAQSVYMKNDLTTNYKIPAEKISVIKNPVALKINNAVDIKQIKKENEILYAGRIEREKGLDYLLDAFKEVLETHPNLLLQIAGEGSLEGKMKNYAKKIAIDKNVIFNGFSSDIISRYKRARLTVLTSLYEGFPNTLVESITLGTPVVAFDCRSGPEEIIKDGVNGYLVNYLDTDHLRDTILKALVYDWNYDAIITSADEYRAGTVIKRYIKKIEEIVLENKK